MTYPDVFTLYWLIGAALVWPVLVIEFAKIENKLTVGDVTAAFFLSLIPLLREVVLVYMSGILNKVIWEKK